MGSLLDDSPIRNSGQALVAIILAKQGLAAKPGTKYAYTFRGYAAVARVVEIVTGKRFSEVLDEKLLKPLGMSDTTFEPKLELMKRLPPLGGQFTNRNGRVNWKSSPSRTRDLVMWKASL